MTLSLAGTLEEAYDVLASPARVVALSDNHVGRFNESPLEVMVGLLDHAPIVDLTTALDCLPGTGWPGLGGRGQRS